MFLLHSVPVVVKIVIPVLPASAPLYIDYIHNPGKRQVHKRRR